MMKILLVDDDTVTLNSISKLLTEFGYDVVTARNGIEAHQEFIKNHFDLVITDIAMPRMNEITLMEEIRNGSYQQHVPVIAICTNPCLPEHSPFDALYRKTLGVERLLDSVQEATKNERK
jgi:CheY-like chemotaxis protein